MAKESVQARESEYEGSEHEVQEHTPGPGEQALQALLAKGRPDPKKVVKLLDTYRGERDVLMALLHKSLGNTYVQEVVKAMNGLRIDTKRLEVAAGDPGNPESTSFLANKEGATLHTKGGFDAKATKDGATWSTADGDFTGKVTKDNATSTYQLDEDDALRADASFKDSKATLAWQRDGKTQAELYGDWKDKEKSEFGLRRQWDLGDGASVTGGYRHQTAKAVGASEAVANDELFATYKNGETTIDGGIGMSGGGLAGSASLATQLGERDKLEAAFRHDAGGTSLSGKHAHTFGSGATLTTDGHIRHADDVTTGKLASSYKDENTTLDGSLTRTADATQYQLGGTQKIDDWTLSGSANYTDRDKGQDLFTGKLAAANKNTALDASVTRGEDATKYHLGGSQKLDAWTLSGTADYTDRDKGNDFFSGKLAAEYKDKNTTFDANIARSEDATSFHLGGKQQLTPELSLGGSFDHVMKDVGADQTTGKLDLSYQSKRLAGDFGIEGGMGARDYLGMKGSVTGQVAPKFYVSGFGGAAYEQGKQTTANLGAGLTFTPSDKTALTLAGVLDQNGHIETRLQFDVFKSRVESAGNLSQAQKSALVSLFVSYSPHGPLGGGIMNDRFGAPTYSHGFDQGGTVQAGIRIKF